MSYIKLVNGIEVPMTPDEISARQAEELSEINRAIVRQISEYRDEISQGIITYNAVEALNDDTTKLRIAEKIDLFMLANESAPVVNWKGPNQWHENVMLADFQGLQLEGGILTQKAFNAQRAVLEINESIPYTSWEDAKEDFDGEML